eukprot:SAG11_NODE_222_length_12140_cov_26.886554_3_plen_75_part_00
MVLTIKTRKAHRLHTLRGALVPHVSLLVPRAADDEITAVATVRAVVRVGTENLTRVPRKGVHAPLRFLTEVLPV